MKKPSAIHQRMMNNASLWKQLPDILIYPLRSYALPILCIFAGFYAILLEHWIFGIAGLVILTPWLFKYSYSVLEHTALGYAEPPEFTGSLWLPFNDLRMIYQLVYIMMLVSIYRSAYDTFGHYVALLIITPGLFLLPANIIMIATNNGFIKSLNPINLVKTVGLLGYDYLIIFFLFSLPTNALYVLIKSHWSVSASDLLVTHNYVFFQAFLPAIIIYLLVMTFHAVGFIVYHRRDSLGLTVSFLPEDEVEQQQQFYDSLELTISPKRKAKRQRPVQREREPVQKQLDSLLDEVYRLKMAGKHAKAINTLLTKLSEMGDSLSLNQQVFERALLWDEKAVALEQAHHYLTLLVSERLLGIALSVYKTCYVIDTDFNIRSADQILLLMNQAYQQGRGNLVLAIGRDFINRYPYHRDMVAVEFLKAKVHDRLRQYREARAILAQLLHHETHPLYPEIEALAKILAII